MDFKDDSQLKLGVREPTPEDYRRACLKPAEKSELTGEIKVSTLGDNDVQKLYKRAEDISEKEEDQKEFFKREKSIHAPRKGEIVKESFPPPIDLVKPEELLREEQEIRKELKVIRYLPESEDLDTVSQVVVTFNQPMVPLTSVDDLKKCPVPVEMTPDIEGEWRYIGTKTVKWKPTHRLPKSTVFEVIVKKGVKSEWGCEMKEDFKFNFTTIPLRLKSFTPSSNRLQVIGPVPEQGAVFCLEFNQKVKEEEIFKFMSVSGTNGNKIIPITKEEAQKLIDSGDLKKKMSGLHSSITRHLNSALEHQFVCFRFEKPLPLKQSFNLKIRSGCPSAEGPRLLEKDLSKSFQTYGPMVKTDHNPKKDIVPNQSWSVTFSNNIELDDFDPDRDVKIEPALERAKIIPSGKTVTIQGASKGKTTYIVTFNQTLTDVYGQKLMKEEMCSFDVGPAAQNMYGFYNGSMIVHDMCMNDKPVFEVVSINLKKIRVMVYQVDPWEYHRSFLGGDYRFHRDAWGHKKELTPNQKVHCGKLVSDKVIIVEDKPDELVETVIPLTPFLQNQGEKCGQLVVFVEPEKSSWTKGKFRYAPRIKTWVQVTHLAVDGVIGYGGEMYSFCSTLEEGRPVEDCKFGMIDRLERKHGVKNPEEEYRAREIVVHGDESGLAFFPGSSFIGALMYAEKGKDICFMPDFSHLSRPTGRSLSYIVNDRNLYKPNETISVKGIFRHLKFETWEKKILIPKKDTEVKWTCYDPRGSKLKEGTTKLNEFGSLFIEIELPDNVNLGTGNIVFNVFGTSFYNNYTVQEFRTPEFSSKATVDPGPYFPGGVAICDAKAEYYSGGGLSGCDVTWKVKQNETSYYPPNFTFRGYSFSCGYSPLKKKEAKDEVVGHLTSLLSGGMDFMSIANDLGAAGGIPGMEKKLEGKTDGSGMHKLCVDFQPNQYAEIKKPTNVTCDLTIQDINRQTMASSTNFMVHPARYYIGIKKKKYFARMGETVPMDLVVTNLDGQVVEGVDIELTIYNRYWERKGYNWKEIERVVGTAKMKSKKEPTPCDIKMEQGGTYYFVCRIEDPEGRPNFCSTNLWVAGGKEKGGGSRVQEEVAKLIGNKTEFDVGDEAKILVSSPFTPAEGLMVVVCNGITQKQRFRIEDDSAVLTVPIRREYVPGATVRVFLSGLNARVDDNTGRPSAAAPKRPAFARGELFLSIPRKSQTLDLVVEPDRKIMRPGESGEVKVEVNSSFEGFNKKEGCAVSVIIVDEAVLALTGYQLSHPVNSFITGNNLHAEFRFLRSRVVMKDWNSIRVEAPPKPILPPAYSSAPGGMFNFFKKSCCMNECCCLSRCCDESKDYECYEDECECCDCGCALEEEEEDGGEGEEPGKAIEVRTDFRPLACFIHDTICKDGVVKVPFTLPDNLTKYRVWVLAHSKENADCFGLGESTIQAQLPVAIRPSLPRFLNFGDRADFTVVVQNQTVDTIKVKVAVRMTNLRLLDESKKGVLVEIPFAQRAELRFPVVTHQCGTGRFQIIGAVQGTDFADAVEKDLPIFTPSTSEAFACYGEVDGDGVVIQSVKAPEEVYNQFGGLTITTSSTALQSLTDAFLYLYNYKFDCVEQISSRMLSINALQKFLYEFNVPKMPTKRDLLNVMESGFKKIRGVMKTDGSLGFWSLTSKVNIYLSIYVAHNLIRCKENGYEVDKTLLNRSKSFCNNVERYIQQYCQWYSEFSRCSLRAFALYVLTIYGVNGELSGHEKDQLSKKAENLYHQKKEFFSHEGKVWLMFCLAMNSRKQKRHPIVLEILKFINQNVNETPETANFITSYGDDGKLVMLHSNRRTDGIILEVLCHVDESNYLIPKIVKGLLAHRKKGRWNSTQENVYILMALKKYFEVFEKLVPDFLCRVWLGDGYAGEVKFKGREVDYKQIEIPMKEVVPDESKIEKKELVIWKKGQGRLYYRLGMDYAPKSHDLKPVDYGFIVERTYEPVTEKNHVKKLEDGVWQFQAGELIRVKLRLTNVSRRYHVALVDSIPSGCEVLNPELKGTEKAPGGATKMSPSRSPYSWYCWWGPWYEHVNLRDERVEAFASYLYCGTHEYEYVMRATTLGEFVVPPAKAEEMYAPELFGRSASEKVIIKE